MQIPLLALATVPNAVRAASIALTGAAITLAALPHGEHRVIAAATVQPAIELAPASVHVQTTEREAPPPPVPLHGGDYAFVFQVGGKTLVHLQTFEASDDLPGHDNPSLSATDGDDATSAIATVRGRAVPAKYRAWLGRSIVVDGTCTANVTGIALVWRLTGDPWYAEEGDNSKWTVDSVVSRGTPALAAVLDGCTGSHSYARDASLPPVVIPEPIFNPDAEARASKLVEASEENESAQEEWEQATEHKGSWWNDKEVTKSIQSLRHPKTGQMFVWMTVDRATEGCGDPPIHVRALFRVRHDGSLQTVSIVHGGLETINQLLDVDGDGKLEVIGSDWLEDDHVLEHTDGTILTTMHVPFFGCPC